MSGCELLEDLVSQGIRKMLRIILSLAPLKQAVATQVVLVSSIV